MRIGKLLSAIAVLVLIFVVATFTSRAGTPPADDTTNAKSTVHPSVVRSPDALTETVPGPDYGLFTCQVGLSSRTCYDPYQMRRAYSVDKLISAGFNGAGKTIVIVDAFQSPNIVQELNFYNSFYGLPSMNGLGAPDKSGLPTFTQVAPDGLTPFVKFDPNMTGWAEEISLDVLWAHAIAPGANIVLDLSTDNSDEPLQAALQSAGDHNMADVISQSFGEAETCLDTPTKNAWHSTYAEATMKGMTVFASSADQGAALPTCDGNSWIKAVSSPASDPLVTGVGGTELNAAGFCLTALGCNPNANPAPGAYLSEIAWNEGPPFGDFQAFFGSTLSSGGGFSTLWSEPSYQKGTLRGT